MIATYNAVFPIPVKDFVRSLLTSLKRNIRFFLPCVIIVIVMFANHAAERMYERAYPDYKEWKETNAAGGNICDYPEQYPEYSENIEIYEQAGLRASWLNMKKRETRLPWNRSGRLLLICMETGILFLILLRLLSGML